MDRKGIRETVDESARLYLKPDAPGGVPGAVLVYTRGEPTLEPAPLGGRSLELGREGALAVDDDWASRRHARVAYDGSTWTVEDLGSRNGTYLDGKVVDGEAREGAPRVLRVGRSLLLLAADIRRFQETATVARDDRVIGPTLREAWNAIERAARFGDTLLMTGESGSGKELAALHYHESGPHASGPFVAVNCAAIPEGVAERLLFGARRGAYSGAVADAEGYVQAADGGTLFLDEVGELEPAVQAKLLRVLEAREVMPLGASRPRPVKLRSCAATHVDLRSLIAAGQFREDLYFRICRPEVRIPPLRERLEDVPWLVARSLARVSAELRAHFSLVEACMLRRWPGNVRELGGELRDAAAAAWTSGRTMVTAQVLRESAGTGFESRTPVEAREDPPDRERIEEALRREGGNVTRAARSLGMHRNQLRRWLARNQIDPRTLSGEGEE